MELNRKKRFSAFFFYHKLPRRSRRTVKKKVSSSVPQNRYLVSGCDRDPGCAQMGDGGIPMVKCGKISKNVASKKGINHRKQGKSEIPMVKCGKISENVASKKGINHRNRGKSEIPMVKCGKISKKRGNGQKRDYHLTRDDKKTMKKMIS